MHYSPTTTALNLVVTTVLPCSLILYLGNHCSFLLIRDSQSYGKQKRYCHTYLFSFIKNHGYIRSSCYRYNKKNGKINVFR